MADMTIRLGVCFAETPLTEIGSKANEILALGWEYVARGDPWSASFRRDVPEEDADAAIAEVKALMGDYWVDAEGMRALKESARLRRLMSS